MKDCPLYEPCKTRYYEESCELCDEFSKFVPTTFLGHDEQKARETFLARYRTESGRIVTPEHNGTDDCECFRCCSPRMVDTRTPEEVRADEEAFVRLVEESFRSSGCKDGILPCGWDD